MNYAISILIAALLIAAAVLLSGRYAIIAGKDQIWRVDRITGDVWICGVFTDQWWRCIKVKTDPPAP